LTPEKLLKGCFMDGALSFIIARVLLVSFVQASLYYAYGSVEFFLAGYLPEVAGLDKFSTGIILTSIIVVAIFTRPYMGRISDKIGREFQ